MSRFLSDLATSPDFVTRIYLLILLAILGSMLDLFRLSRFRRKPARVRDDWRDVG